jgi:glucose-6-phosphate isomerase
MTSPELMASSLERLKTFADSVRRDGTTDVVLLGMGGSSLAPEVLRAVIGGASGWPRLHMLDSTDPAAVLAAATPPATTLHVLASKSGTTIEPNSLAAHFRDRLVAAGVTAWSKQFVAITDAGTELDTRAHAEGFRDVFINPTDIGGRYSALSFFGMVPAALMGQDVDAIVDWGLMMLEAADPSRGDASTNPAIALGLAMAAGALNGRDKLTLVVPHALEPFGLWVEQLIAESTGKNGKGVVPIAGEPWTPSTVYGADRLFVRIHRHHDDLPAFDAGGAPIVDLELAESPAIGAEFVRWEIATAVAGGVLGINPFDEPNVQQAKDATKALLARYTNDGALPEAPVDQALGNGVRLTLSAAAKQDAGDAGTLLKRVRQGDYVAILAYLGPDARLADQLHILRAQIRDRTRAATMFGYGPRYLHSTGQLHKGGPNTGVFILISATPRQDVVIPGEPFSFATLEQAQALGDFQSLDATGRRAVHVHLPSPDPALVAELRKTLL